MVINADAGNQLPPPQQQQQQQQIPALVNNNQPPAPVVPPPQQQQIPAPPQHENAVPAPVPAPVPVAQIKTEPDDGVVMLGNTLKRALRKDFKIRGSIGLPGQKEKLTFSSLAFQINSGVKKNYPEEDICDEVIRVCDGSAPLRPILEGKTNLTLGSLRSILRSYFQEKDPTTLFTKLSNAVQKSTETAMDFVMAMWDLRQKVIFVTNEMDSRVRYSEDLVQDQFVRTVITGLRNDNIRNEVKAVITGDMEVEELLEVTNRASSDEKERITRLGKHTAKVAKIGLGVSSDDEDGEGAYSLLRDSPIMAELKQIGAKMSQITASNTELQNEVADLKDQVELVRGGNKDGDGDGENKREEKKSKIRFGCKSCKQKQKRNCNHCFGCGSENHVKADCPGN